MKNQEALNVWFRGEEELELYNALRKQAFQEKGESMSKTLKDGATIILKRKKYL